MATSSNQDPTRSLRVGDGRLRRIIRWTKGSAQALVRGMEIQSRVYSLL